MKAANFEYARPVDVGEAIGLLRQSDGMGKALAGGQSLVPMMSLRLAQPGLLVDLAGIERLRASEAADGALAIGAMVRHAAIEDGKAPDPANGMLRHVAAGIAYRGVRIRGTVGGSVAHGDPAADWPTALLALGAEVEVAGPDGERRLPLGDFQAGAFTTTLAPDQLLTAIRVPRLSSGARWAYYKLCRKAGEFADSMAAVVHDPERGHARAVLGALDGAPRVIEEVSEGLAAGARFAEGFDAAAAAAVLARAGISADPVRTRMHATVLSRAVRRAFQT